MNKKNKAGNHRLERTQNRKSQNRGGGPTAAKRLYQSTDIQGATITADALHSYYLSCHHPRRAEFFAGLIRGHWGGCEIRDHWVRDAIFEEDSTRSKNVTLNGNLAILRGALIALKSRLVPDKSWPFIRELSSMK
ncbi:MAG: hypothetical protein WC076_11225, partial [Terrimicrobiaceae bacterium]